MLHPIPQSHSLLKINQFSIYLINQNEDQLLYYKTLQAFNFLPTHQTTATTVTHPTPHLTTTVHTPLHPLVMLTHKVPSLT